VRNKAEATAKLLHRICMGTSLTVVLQKKNKNEGCRRRIGYLRGNARAEKSRAGQWPMQWPHLATRPTSRSHLCLGSSPNRYRTASLLPSSACRLRSQQCGRSSVGFPSPCHHGFGRRRYCTKKKVAQVPRNSLVVGGGGPDYLRSLWGNEVTMHS
jgi:hypothetical protein